MGSSKSSAGTQTHYIATIAVELCQGPVRTLKAILVNGERVWSGILLRSATTNPVNLTCDSGTIIFYWGTEDQTVSPVLNAYEEHPPYRGTCYLILRNWDFGLVTSAPNIEAILEGGAPQQSIVTGAPAAESLDGGTTVNGVCWAAEILTSEIWHGLSADSLVASSFQQLAEDLQGTAVRPLVATSPLVADQTDTRTLLAAVLDSTESWARLTPAGQIEVGRWIDSAPGAVTELTHDDFSEIPSTKDESEDDPPNSYAVEFVDRTALHKGAKTLVDDQAGIVALARLNRKTLSREDLVTYEQAQAAGAEALRRATARGTWSGAVRIGQARTPAGARLQPGDYLRVPATPPDAAVQLTELVRVTQVVWPANAVDAVEIEADRCPLSAAALTIAIASDADELAVAVPPINRARVVVLPSQTTGDQPPIYVLAAKPSDAALGCYIHFDAALSGDFPRLATQANWALPVTIDNAIGSAANELTLSLLPAGAAGQNYRRSDALLREWTGGTLEARNDELLLVLVVPSSTGTAAEVCSIAGPPTLVDADTFTVPILRGRLGTTAAFHATTVEAWVVLRAGLVGISHADLLAAAETADLRTMYFRPGAYQVRATYSPYTANTERLRRIDDELALEEYSVQPDAATWYPTLSLVIPAGYYQPEADGDELPGGDFSDIQGDLFQSAPALVMEYRAKSVTAELVGFNEWVSASRGIVAAVPPRKFFHRTYSGAINQTQYFIPSLGAGISGTAQTDYPVGIASFDPLTGTITPATRRGRIWNPQGVLSSTTTENYSGPDTIPDDNADQHITSASTTAMVSTGTGVVHTDEAGEGNYLHVSTGSLNFSQSDEDTEEEALERAIASDWSSWTNAATARHEARTSGFVFGVTEVQGRGSATGCVAGFLYIVTVPTRVRTIGTADWVDGPAESFSAIATSTGLLTVPEFSIVAERGYERKPLQPTITPQI